MQGKSKAVTWLALVVVVCIAVAGTYFVMSGGAGDIFSQKKVVEGEETILPTECQSTTSPNLTVLVQDKYSHSATAVNYAYRVNGGTWTTGNGASISISGNPGALVDIELAPDNTSYYGESTYGYVMPCSETPQFVMEVATVATTSMTSLVWNDDGTPNSATVAQALGAGENPNLELKLKGEKDKDYGDPFDGEYNVLVCPFNKTTFDDMTISGLTEADGIPDQVDLTSGYSYKAWEVPILSSNTQNNGQGLVYTITLDTDDTNQPTILDNITCTLYDAQTYWDGTSGVSKYLTGVEDETNTDVGISSEESFTIYVT